MSTSAILFGTYLGIGMLFLVVAVATPGKEKRADALGSVGGGDFDVALLIFVALVWPLWLLSLLSKESKK